MKISMTIASVAIAALTVTGLAGCGRAGSSTAAAAPAPTVTVTVAADPVSTGVDQSTYDACQQAYQQVVAILGKQTDILQGVSYAASDGFTAAADGDVTALEDATSKVTDLTTRETNLQSDIAAVDSGACQ